MITSRVPLKGTPLIFTDGSKSGCGAYLVQGFAPIVLQFPPASPQVIELQIVIKVFEQHSGAFNLISDSQYVVNALAILEVVGRVNLRSSIGDLLSKLQNLLLHRSSPFFVQHIRAHTGLPGPLAEGNDIVDKAAQAAVFLACPALDLARDFHSKFHVNSKTLASHFGVTRAEAREIFKACQACPPLLPQPSFGVNPRGLLPLQVWQMDVTHFAKFGKLQFVHVSIDTASEVIFASLHTGEKSCHVIAHCFEAWGAWGQPKELKTDNGPAYTSNTFVSFCKMMGVHLVHGIPYNPQGQGIIGCAHRTLKECLRKQKGFASPMGLSFQ